MRIYLDNCSFNRPFDDQTQLKVKMETEAKLSIQSDILLGKFGLVWSYILEYENSENPYHERKDTIQRWKSVAGFDCEANAEILELAVKIEKSKIKPKDALHIACALFAKCKYFITTDEKILNKNIKGITIINPIDFIRRMEGNMNEDGCSY